MVSLSIAREIKNLKSANLRFYCHKDSYKIDFKRLRTSG